MADPKDDFADLDAMLEEAKALAADKGKGQKLREKIKRGEGTADDAALLAEWEARHQWKDVANVALFERYKCGHCQRHQTVFRALLRKQEHRQLRASYRYVKTDAQNPDLEQELVVQKWDTPMCTSCAPRNGFDFSHNVITELEGPYVPY